MNTRENYYNQRRNYQFGLLSFLVFLFHKKDSVSGMQYWRVTGPRLDLSAKDLYQPGPARDLVKSHATHFAGLVEEILAAYLTFTPYGGNLEGIEAASWAYFGHGPAELSADEIAVLLAVPQNPARRAPTATQS